METEKQIKGEIRWKETVMLKHPVIKKEETLCDVNLGNGEHIDIYTVDHLKKENTGYLKVYVSELGKVRVYVNKDDDIEIVDWKGHSAFMKHVSEDEDKFYDEQENQ